MNSISTKYRSSEKELLDGVDLDLPELREVFSDLDKVNNLLGGIRITIGGLEKLLQDSEWIKPVRIMDVGCGNGSMLRKVAQWGRDHKIQMDLIGVDLNEGAIQIAREQSAGFPEITFRVMDVLSEEVREWKSDVILCTLTLHHFRDQEIISFLQELTEKVNIGIVINDLERSALAYHLFTGFCAFFIKNRISKRDGLTSILRSFRKSDLREYARHLSVRKQEISWKWAFRYQWIIYK